MVVIGVDGGGTKTRLVVVDESTRNQLAERTGESTNSKSVGEDKAFAVLKALIEGVLQDAGKSVADVTAICLGMAGVDRPADKAPLEKFVRSVITQSGLKVVIENDGITALASGTQGVLDGIVVISGTGTITLGVHQGARHRCQGWGAILGDEGGGDSMGLHCLKAVARAEDGGKKTIMTQMVLKELNLESAWGLIDWCYGEAKFTFSKFAALARVVLEAAKQGDDVALTILDQKAESIVESIRIVATRLKLGGAYKLVLSGGNLTHDDGKGIYASILKRKLAANHPNADIVFPSVDPAVAAALLAFN
jgi:N-acetylglucosamine kinase-like BadF-type ATPase